MKSIGFIGLGIMGNGMARNLMKNGFNLIVYNRTAARTLELAELGADVAGSPAEVARSADIVITMVSDDEALRQVYWGQNGIIDGAQPSQTIIDCSTVSPTISMEIHDKLKTGYVSFLDAPVTGSKDGANEGQLTFMVGGDHAVMEEHLDIFNAMGRKTVYVGPSGSGSKLKLAHNAVVAINTAAVCEGMLIAAKSGIRPDVFLEVLLSGGANSRAVEMKGPKIVERDFSPHFSLKLMLKDLKLAGRMTDDLGVGAPMLGAVKSLFQESVNQSWGEEDVAALVKVYEQAQQFEVAASASIPRGAIQADERRRSTRVPMDIPLHLSIYQWKQEGSFSGQTIEGILYDLSDNGLQFSCKVPLSMDMFVIIHFPQESKLPPITGKIIRIENKEYEFRYGCMLSGLPPITRLQLDKYLSDKLQEM